MPTTVSRSKTGASKPPPDEDSDVDIEGIDQEDDDYAESGSQGGDDEDAEDAEAIAARNKELEKEKEVDEMALKEQRELEDAKKERMELIASEQKSLTSEDAVPNQGKATLEEKFHYLVSQSEVFAHFLAGSVAVSGKKKGKGGNRGKKGRLTEEEEDAQLLKSAQSKRRTIRLDSQPSNLAAICKMHPYQLEGLNWLIKLHDHGINGILADEMGLGKTLQTISLLAYLRESRGCKGPHLVVVPKSVVGNWCREFKKWCPVIRVVKMLGTKEQRKVVVSEELKPVDGKIKFDVIVTSYEGILREKGPLSKINWKYLIIDEAHRIKNPNSSLSLVVREMKTDFRLLITGTPLQNNLNELWALLNFILPEIFGDAEQFDKWFSLSGDEGQQNVIKKLHTVLRPFMIRRVKKDVACGLPPKKETKLYIGLTPMQQEWYKRLLRKDAHELNSLGGPDKVRLLNVLMQLRKVCNHPYLFEGAEAGPPYYDGPHLWENSGKMSLLHKLLPKLKAQGSRILIFSQMTRILDILEDYFRLVNYQYCRIDGNTDGEARDSQMDVFNAPDSEKFAFLLSTRAGGLGINLATADIVILYDSDWNPQVDLQAMDRAHRIGQTKPVQVFRFVTEGSVEEKIIERADRKLFLDAAVIQQGRLAEQNSKLNKDELMKMVKFGADQILSGNNGTYTDEDIDALIAKGEQKTSAIKDKLKTDAQHNLADFSLLGEDETGKDTFDFGGENYRTKAKSTGTLINLPQRERKRNYNVNEYFRESMSDKRPETKKRKKGQTYHDFQLFNKPRLEYFENRERDLAIKRAQRVEEITELRSRAKSAPSLQNARADVRSGNSREELDAKAIELENTLLEFELTKEEEAEKRKLLSEGFLDWSKKDFRIFCSSLEKCGRFGIKDILKEVTELTGKTDNEVKKYYICFWLRYKRINDWQKVIERIEKGEKKILRYRQIRDIIHEKVERHFDETYGHMFIEKKDGLPTHDQLLDHAWQTLKLKYVAGSKHRSYTEEEDAFLLCMMHRHGFGANERIRLEIRRAFQFRFNWYFKSRSSQEIQRRCESIVKMVEKEIADTRKAEEDEEQKKVAASSGAPSSVPAPAQG